MTELVMEVSAASLDQDVLAAAGPVLLDLWAPWCAPCHAMAPILKSIAAQYQGSLQIAKVDVERYPKVQQRFGVRGIPTLILFRNGEELARKVGVHSGEDMHRWLLREGVEPAADAPVPSMASLDEPRWGAFYGDVELRHFLVTRLRTRAAEGRVIDSRVPFWLDGKGTISSALVGSTDFQVFQGITGLPASFACVLEFCVQSDLQPEAVDALLGGVSLGADLRSVAPRMMVSLFDGSLGDWAVVLGDDALDALRVRWLALATRAMVGQDVGRDEWQALRSALDALTSVDKAPGRAVQDEFITALMALTPLPQADDGASWVMPMLMSGKYLLFVLAASALGWKDAEFGVERFRHAWFTQREQQEPGGEFTDETLEVARGEWMRDHGDRQRALDAFFSRYEECMAPLMAKVRACLAGCISGAPVIAAV